jgi:Zn-dependent protease
MFPALNLGRLFGIPLRVHFTFWFLPLYVILASPAGTPIPFVLLMILAIFGCVVLHELGHALAARWYGIRTRDITLYPIGGVASLQRISEKPLEELVIAIAGPAVNVIIVAALTVVIALAHALSPATFVNSLLSDFLEILWQANGIMILFNLIPAFPLDGGRIFRACLGFFVDHLQATRVAVYVGTPLTLLLMVLVVLKWQDFMNPFLFIIAFFVIMAGQQELAMLEYRERMRRASPMGSPTVTASSLPSWMQPAVTVYVWDPANGVWVRQEQRA